MTELTLKILERWPALNDLRGFAGHDGGEREKRKRSSGFHRALVTHANLKIITTAMGGKLPSAEVALPSMTKVLLALTLACSACAVTNPRADGSRDIVMTATGHGNECLFTLGGEAFLTDHLESATLNNRLRKIRGRSVILQFSADAPYRCAGSAIISLQRAKMKFRTPQVPP